DIMSTIYRMIQEEPPVVAIYAPLGDLDPRYRDPEVRQMLRQMGQEIPERPDNYKSIVQILTQEGYDARRIELTESDPIPEGTKTLLVMATDPLNDRQKYEIERFIAGGGHALFAVQEYNYDYAPDSKGGMRVMPMRTNQNANDLLMDYGLWVEDRILMDQSMETLNIPVRQMIGGMIPAMVDRPVQVPVQIRLTSNNMNQDFSVTNRISSLLYLWGTALDIHDEIVDSLELKVDNLIWSSDKSWTIPGKTSPLKPEDVDLTQHELEPNLPLGVMVNGQFPDNYAGKPVPVWPGTAEEEGVETIAEPVEGAPSKVVLYGCAEIFSDRLLNAFGNGLLFLNSVDALTLGEDLISIRSKFSTIRYIDEVSSGGKLFWRFATIFLVPILFIIYGIIKFMLRRKKREDYMKTVEAMGN
ncbi:MAG: hypothetical protein GF307_11955, partial [candidate division Zixibacteria bacterium]|nr:hypothetical protein [candidate division Zixibacteria bacterium]